MVGPGARPPRGFPLHADLFLPSMLLTVFDQVPAGETGASIFLPTVDLYRVLDTVAALPADVRDRIRACFTDRSGDHFDELVHLLYHPRHAWSAELAQRLRDAQHRTLFAGGEGYVLDDRRWLHGREPQVFPVETSRLCRVVFDPSVAIRAT